MSALLQVHACAPLLNSQPFKVKRVTDPLNKAVLESLCRNWTHDAGRMASVTPCSTSGSAHDIDSTILSHMVTGFLDEQQHETQESPHSFGPTFSQECESDAEISGAQDSISADEYMCEMLEGVSSCSTTLEFILLRDVTEALATAKEKAGLEKEFHKSSVRRFVMNSLRCAGYNAGICKSRWEQTNGYPAGDYEFIDVILDGMSETKKDRLLVDIDFRGQFEIARPSAQYKRLLQVLPSLFVGRTDKLLEIVKIMCDAARRSFRSEELHIPPWRKFWYISAKWVGPYKRTINPASTSTDRGGRQILRDFVGIGALEGMGVGLDASFFQQLVLHFEKAMREATNAHKLKLESEGQRQPLTSNYKSFGREEDQSRLTTKNMKLGSSVIVFPRGKPLTTSGLATALAVRTHTDPDKAH